MYVIIECHQCEPGVGGVYGPFPSETAARVAARQKGLHETEYVVVKVKALVIPPPPQEEESAEEENDFLDRLAKVVLRVCSPGPKYESRPQTRRQICSSK